jgi:asparagine synthase (glutamine-hydrolysing)
MCGIAGILNLRGNDLPPLDTAKILQTLRHRGPDDSGVFQSRGVFLGATRLAIIDPAMGKQPVQDEVGRYHLVMNGEIFDYGVLMKQLQDRGHRFRSHCDTEVVVHLVEESWSGIFDRIDGQYAIAAYDAQADRLLLARDRMGICPLFYAVVGEHLVFASEMKAIFATGLVKPEIAPRSLDAVLSFGCVPAPNAMFKGIRQLMPGRFLEVAGGAISERTYWDIPFNDAGQYPRKSIAQWSQEFRDVLHGACRRRLKADVPVGLYLSGGIDSSTLAAMTADAPGIAKRVFSIGFPEPGFDESAQTRRIADFLGIEMHLLNYEQKDLSRDLPRLIYHGESPLVSTESVPLMALSHLASKHVKVVLTGEGSDETLGGYIYFHWDVFKALIGDGAMGRCLLKLANVWLRHNLGPVNPFLPSDDDARWAQDLFGCYPGIMLKFFYFRALRAMVCSRDSLDRQAKAHDGELLDLPRDRMRRWDPLNRTLYLSSRIFMTNHLLGSHGDRALMANSVEGRYPFLDRQVQEFMAAVPPGLKRRWRTDKYLLRKAMAHRLPAEVIRRHKKPFLAPFGTPFVGKDYTDQIRDLLSPRSLSEFGHFDPAKVHRIVAELTGLKDEIALDPGETMRPNRQAIHRTLLGMALTFVVSTQILEDHVRRGRFNGNHPEKATGCSGPETSVRSLYGSCGGR